MFQIARRLVLAAAVVLLGLPAPVRAQHEHHVAPPVAGWDWRVDAQAFLNVNLQERKFRDFHVVESQNWFMTNGTRRVGRGRLDLHGMLSLEPWTVRDLGSPQVFQTGESFRGAPLVDYQHPHDFVMQATIRFESPLDGQWRFYVEGGPVGAPAIGPTPFMHRPSADVNPTVPLSHHNFDATHVTHGVVTGGVTRGSITVEASAFHGREPDEDRVAIEFGPIDSYAGRVWFRRGAWVAQLSAAQLTEPDRTEFSDHKLFTASLSYNGTLGGRPLAVTGAFGVVDEPGTGRRTPAGLIEGIYRPSPQHAFYTRGELMKKDVLTRGGFHPPGFTHPHILSSIGALTVGYERRLFVTRIGQFGVGADLTGYYRDVNLSDGYGDPLSAHIFLRYRFDAR